MQLIKDLRQEYLKKPGGDSILATWETKFKAMWAKKVHETPYS
jgi:hypothetical protein